MNAPVLGLALSCVLLPAAASAQSLGMGRALSDPSARAEPDEEPGSGEARGDDDGAREDAGPWPGPQIQLGYAYSKLADAYGGGDTHAAAFEVFIHWPLSELRTSVYAALGGRDFSLAGDDFFARAGLAVGFQLTRWLEPLVPHVSAIVTAGAVVGERFETTVAYGLGGAGIELGAALQIVRSLHLHASLSYLRLEMDGAAFDVFELRVGFGL